MLRPARPLTLACGLVLLLLTAASPQPAPSAPLDLDRGSVGLGLALRRLGVAARVLYVTAHPDDENNGVLVRLARGRGVRTALFTLTRGEGGQNAIGPELFEALGVLRTAELESLHRYDGVEQYFGRAYEFGFSFSVEESLARWGREDDARRRRALRAGVPPDVILTLPLEGDGGGHHHFALAPLGAGRLPRRRRPRRASRSRWRDGLRPWQARRIYVGGVGGTREGVDAPVLVARTSVYDPLLGQTWAQLGSRARAHAPLAGHAGRSWRGRRSRTRRSSFSTRSRRRR